MIATIGEFSELRVGQVIRFGKLFDFGQEIEWTVDKLNGKRMTAHLTGRLYGAVLRRAFLKVEQNKAGKTSVRCYAVTDEGVK